MSKFMSAFYNNTGNSVQLVVYNEGITQTVTYQIAAQSWFTPNNQLRVPDNSDSSHDFAQQHIEVQDGSGNPLVSFWDDDATDANGLQPFNLLCCQGVNYQQTTSLMAGSFPGNSVNAFFVLSGNNQLTAFPNKPINLPINLTREADKKLVGTIGVLTLSQNSYGTGGIINFNAFGKPALAGLAAANPWPVSVQAVTPPPVNTGLPRVQFVVANVLGWVEKNLDKNGQPYPPGQTVKKIAADHDFAFQCNWDGQSTTVSNGLAGVPARWMAAIIGLPPTTTNDDPDDDDSGGEGEANATWTGTL